MRLLKKPVSLLLSLIMILSVFTIIPATSASAETTAVGSVSKWVQGTEEENGKYRFADLYSNVIFVRANPNVDFIYGFDDPAIVWNRTGDQTYQGSNTCYVYDWGTTYLDVSWTYNTDNTDAVYLVDELYLNKGADKANWYAYTWENDVTLTYSDAAAPTYDESAEVPYVNGTKAHYTYDGLKFKSNDNGTYSQVSDNELAVPYFEFEQISDNSYKLTKCNAQDANIVVPDTIPVTYPDNLFWGKNITVIAGGAFEGNTNLVSIEIGDNVNHIGSDMTGNSYDAAGMLGAFEGCSSLETVKIGSAFNYAETHCFDGCSSLEHIETTTHDSNSESYLGIADIATENGDQELTILCWHNSSIASYFANTGINNIDLEFLDEGEIIHEFSPGTALWTWSGTGYGVTAELRLTCSVCGYRHYITVNNNDLEQIPVDPDTYDCTNGAAGYYKATVVFDNHTYSDDDNKSHTCTIQSKPHTPETTGEYANLYEYDSSVGQIAKISECSVCGKVYNGNWISVSLHEANNATCTRAGNYEYCTDNDGNYYRFLRADGYSRLYTKVDGENDVIIPLNPAAHVLYAHPAKEPTLSEDGNTAYWNCTKCGKFFSDANGQNEIAQGSWVLPKTAVAYVADDYYTESFYEAVQYATAHNGATIELLKNTTLNYDSHVAATNYPTFKVKLNGHTLDVTTNYPGIYAVNTSVPDSYGVTTYTLTHNHSYDVTWSKTPVQVGDNWEAVATFTCKYCGDAHNITSIKEDSDVIKVTADCTNEGYKKAAFYAQYGDINVSTNIKWDVVAALGHDLTEHPAKEPTVSQDGNTAYWSCSRCHKFFLDAACEHEIEEDSWILEKTAVAYIADYAGGYYTENFYDAVRFSNGDMTIDLLKDATLTYATHKAVVDHPTFKVRLNDNTLTVETPEADEPNVNTVSTTGPVNGVTTYTITHKHGWKAEWNDMNPVDHETYWDVDVLFTCVYCGETQTKKATAQHDSQYTEIVEANCTQGGYKKSNFSAQLDNTVVNNFITWDVVNALGHNIVVHPAKPVTVSQDGNTAYWSCMRCGKFFSDENCENEIAENSWIIPRTAVAFIDRGNGYYTDSFKDALMTATDTYSGATIELLKDAALEYPTHEFATSYPTFKVKLNGHNLNVTTLFPDIYTVNTEGPDSDGITTYTLTHKHEYDVTWSETPVKAGDNWEAEATFTCAYCKFTHTETASTSNDQVTVLVPNCLVGGYKEAPFSAHYGNTYANATLTWDLEGPLGHDLIEHPANPATVSQDGNTAYWSCSRCGKFFSDANAKTEIAENSWILEKTAVAHIADELYTESFYEAVQYATAHNIATIDLLKDTTLTYPDHKAVVDNPTFKVRLNDHTLTVETPEADEPNVNTVSTTGPDEGGVTTYTLTHKHGWIGLWNDMNPVDRGTYWDVDVEFTCVYCDETQTVKATAQHDSSYTEIVDATCTEGGYKKSNFSAQLDNTVVNNFITWDLVNALGHNLTEHPAHEPTLSDDGNSAYWSCSRCGKFFSDAEAHNEIDENSWILEKTAIAYLNDGNGNEGWFDDLKVAIEASVAFYRTPILLLKDVEFEWDEELIADDITSFRVRLNRHILGITAPEGYRVNESTADGITTYSLEALPYTMYLAEDGTDKKAYDATPITSDFTVLTDGWYRVDGNVIINHDLMIQGDVKIILTDGSVLSINDNIRLNDDQGPETAGTITFYRQSGDYQGKLNAISITADDFTLVGGELNIAESVTAHNDANISGGNLTVKTQYNFQHTALSAGGNVNISGGNSELQGSCGIYAVGSQDSAVNISGGRVNAHGNHTAINSYHVNITGGNVTAVIESDVEQVDNIKAIIGLSDITLSWTNQSDSIYAKSYSRDVTLLKTFKDYNDNLYNAGTVKNSKIADKTLYPPVSHEHPLAHVEEKPATCTESGHIEYWSCEVCNKLYADANGYEEIDEEDTVIQATGHVWNYSAGEWNWQGTHDSPAVTFTYPCENCTETQTLTNNDLVVTSPTSEPATCTTAGSITYKASIAHGVYTYSSDHTYDIPALGHETTHTAAVAPTYDPQTGTYTDGNIEYWYCSRCNKYFSDEACETEVAPENIAVHYFVFRYNSVDNEVGVYEYHGTDTVVTIPDKVPDDYPDEALRGRNVEYTHFTAFRDNTSITKVVMGDNIKHIGWESFRRCTGIKEIVIGSGLKKIDSNVFFDSTSLEKFTCTTTEGNINTYRCFNSTGVVTFYGYHSGSFREAVRSTNFDISRKIYIGIDEHTYSAHFNWDGYECPNADLTCTQCDVPAETVDATVTSSITTEATPDAEGVRTYTATAVYNDKTFTDTKEETIPKTSCFTKHSLTLAGDIGVNFYIDYLNADDVAAGKVRVDFVCNGKNCSVTVGTDTTEVEGRQLYKATCYVSAAEMKDDITATLYIDNVETCTDHYTVRQYADVILNGDFDQKDKDVVGAMLNYGAMAQKQFDHNTDYLANAGVTGYDLVVLTPAEIEALGSSLPNSADTADALSAYGVKYYGCSLLLRSKTTLRFYFEKTDATKFDAANFKIDGNTVEVNNYGDGSRYVYIEVTNIAAPDLAATHKVAVGNVEIGNVSPLNYAKDVLSDADASADLKNVMTALYRFYEAADKRF